MGFEPIARSKIALDLTLKAVEKMPLPSDPEAAGAAMAKMYVSIIANLPFYVHEIEAKTKSASAE